MSDTNPDKPTPPSDADKERLAKIAASLPGEVVSRDAAFPKKRQRPKARLPEPVRKKIESDATEEAAKDTVADGPKAPIEKPKFKVTRSPFAPRIDQTTKPADTWGDEEETPKAESKPEVKPAPEVAKKAEPEVKKSEPEAAKPEAKKFEPKPIPRPTPTKLDISRAPFKEEVKAEEKKEEPATPEIKPVAKETAKPEIKPAAKEEPKVVPMPKPTPVAAKKPVEAKPAAKQPLPTPVAKASPTKLPVPAAKAEGTSAAKPATSKLPKPAAAAPRSAPRPKAAPAPGRHAQQQPEEEENTGMSIVWVAFDAIAAVATLAFAALTFMNMGG
ncbi:hypothetical protein [Cerasicoccus maritimus]|uniref:hypothetical protein n=1 Tax=Cerasicoccus maritimus TaxID=490089 RepID=UPI002852D526|nr:hypothetical protein [Cerasicoccus maritimus]